MDLNTTVCDFVNARREIVRFAQVVAESDANKDTKARHVNCCEGKKIEIFSIR